MNEKQKKEAEKKFKQYQKRDLSIEDLKKAESKAELLGDKMNDFKLLLEMVKDHWNGDFVINKSSLAIIIGAILYVVSPIDAIPDVIPVLGWIDDISVLGFALTKVQSVIKEYIASKENLK